MDGCVELWDISRLTGVQRVLVDGTAPLNSLQGLSYTSNETGFFAITREGIILGYDLRTSTAAFPSVKFT